MLKQHILAGLLVSAVAFPAYAQSTSPTAPAVAPSTSASSTMPASSGEFMTKAAPDQVMASKLIGTRVMGSNNESIGDVNDVIMDSKGQAIAAIVGVGGFLGIGEKDVAVPFAALEFLSEAQVAATNNANAPASAPATTGSTATAPSGTMGTAAGTGTRYGHDGDEQCDDFHKLDLRQQPATGHLRMTKEQLQAAPKFDASANRYNLRREGAPGLKAGRPFSRLEGSPPSKS